VLHVVRMGNAWMSDWAAIWPIWKGIVDDGETYAYPETATSEEANAWWLEAPPSRFVVAVDDEVKVFGHREDGAQPTRAR